jgi:hypothetical protein
VGAKVVYRKYTLPPHLREVGYFNLGIVVGTQTVRLPRLSGIPRRALRLAYPPHPYHLSPRTDVLMETGTTDERWWDQHVWAGQEGDRIGQRRFALEVLGRDAVCHICGTEPAEIAHHDPPWSATRQHNVRDGHGVCSACHRRLHQGDG